MKTSPTLQVQPATRPRSFIKIIGIPTSKCFDYGKLDQNVLRFIGYRKVPLTREFEFVGGVETVELRPEYERALRCGDVLPGDTDTAIKFNLPL
jgi:hypothetical protein